jgi:hypothetical protein
VYSFIFKIRTKLIDEKSIAAVVPAAGHRQLLAQLVDTELGRGRG